MARRNRNHRNRHDTSVSNPKSAKYEQTLARLEAAGEATYLGSSFTALALFLKGNLSNIATFNFYGTIGFTVAVASQVVTLLIQLRDGLDSNNASERKRAAKEFIAKLCVVVPFTAGLIQYYMSDENFEDKAQAENFFGSAAFAVGITFHTALTLFYTKEQLDAFKNDADQSSTAMLIRIILNLANPAGLAAGVALFMASNKEENSSYGLYGIGAFMGGIAAQAANFGWGIWQNRSSLFTSGRASNGASRERESEMEHMVATDDDTTPLLNPYRSPSS